MTADTLANIYANYTTPDGYGDKGTAHSYIDAYEHLLAPLRDIACAVLEIGVGPQALSLRMWHDYFPRAQIVGVDTSPIVDPLPARVKVVCANAYDRAAARELGAHSPYDLIIDDGSHLLGDQLAAARMYRPLLSKDGLFIVEDVVNIDLAATEFRRVAECEIYDFRNAKGRHDDVLVVYRRQ